MPVCVWNTGGKNRNALQICISGCCPEWKLCDKMLKYFYALGDQGVLGYAKNQKGEGRKKGEKL